MQTHGHPKAYSVTLLPPKQMSGRPKSPHLVTMGQELREIWWGEAMKGLKNKL